MAETLVATPAQCYPWCSWPDDHPTDDACYSAECFVDLSSYTEIVGEHRGPGGYGDGPDQITVCAYAASPISDAHLLVAHSSQPGFEFFQFELTPAEAQQMIEALQLVLGQIEVAR